MPTLGPLARRLPRALLVALATALVFGGLLGTVQAASGHEAATHGFRMGRPSIGDHWTYQALLEGDWNFGSNDTQGLGQPFTFADLEWQDPVLIRDAEGLEVAADVLHVRSLDYNNDPESARFYDDHLWVPKEERTFFRLGTTESVAGERHVTSRQLGAVGSGIAVGPGGPLQTSSETAVEGWSRYFETFGYFGQCLARSPLQEHPQDLDKGLPSTMADCLPRFPSDADKSPAADPVRYVGREVVAGRETLRFDGPTASLWLSESTPVPVQAKAWDGTRSAVVTLSSFQAGSNHLGSLGPVAGPSVAPPVVMGPRRLWGPDDTGVAVPWPASAAFQAALTDPRFSQLRDWLAANPDGTTFLLEYGEDLDAVPAQRTWFFGLTDQDSRYAFTATRSSVDSLPMLPPTVQFQDMAGFSLFLDYLAPHYGMLPDTVPTVASTLARWQAYETLEGRDPTANGWGMALWCVSVLCDYGVLGGVVAGRDPVALFHFENIALRPGIGPADVLGRSFTGSQIEIRSDGTTTALVNWTGYDDGIAGQPLAGKAPVDPTAHAQPRHEVRFILQSFVPTAGQAGAVSLFATLVGLLYYLWPSLKGGSFLGLFSRLQGSQLLVHPSRARLMQVIQAEPGIHFQDLVRRSGLPNGTAVHHARKLEQAGLIAARPLGRYTCYFPGTPERAALAAAPVTRSDGAKRILAEIVANPGLSGSELAVRLGLQPSTVTYHVKRLEQVGLLQSVRDGRSVRLRATASA